MKHMRYHLFPLRALLLSAVVVGLLGCQPRPGENSPEATDPPADSTVSRHGEQHHGGEASPDGSTSLGIALPTLIDNAADRDPESGQLEVLDRLNEPERVSTESHPNRHVPGQIDTLRTLHYDNVHITIYEVSGGKEILQNVTVTGPRLATAQEVEVGSSRSAVEDRLGDPDERDGDAYVYLENGPMPTRFYIYFAGDTVDRLEWHFAID